MKEKSYIIHNLHLLFIRHAEFDGKIKRGRVAGIISQRIGKCQEHMPAIIKELKEHEVIIGEDKFYYIINKKL
jgi:hypothetical protein